MKCFLRFGGCHSQIVHVLDSVYMETKVHVWTFALKREALQRKNEIFINLEFSQSQFTLSSLLWVVDAVKFHQNLWSHGWNSDESRWKCNPLARPSTKDGKCNIFWFIQRFCETFRVASCCGWDLPALKTTWRTLEVPLLWCSSLRIALELCID